MPESAYLLVRQSCCSAHLLVPSLRSASTVSHEILRFNLEALKRTRESLVEWKLLLSTEDCVRLFASTFNIPDDVYEYWKKKLSEGPKVIFYSRRPGGFTLIDLVATGWSNGLDRSDQAALVRGPRQLSDNTTWWERRAKI